MQSQQTDLGTAPVGKLLTRLAVPAITAQMVNMLYNLVDRVYIGHLPDVGTQALTGVGVCFPIIMLVSAFAGYDHVMHAYHEAVKSRYRFFSFGDAMLIQ